MPSLSISVSHTTQDPGQPTDSNTLSTHLIESHKGT